MSFLKFSFTSRITHQSFKYIEPKNCGITSTCRDSYMSTLKYDGQRINIVYGTYQRGHQKYNYGMFLKKGTIICVRQDTPNTFAMRKNVEYPDLRVYSNTELLLSDFTSDNGIYFNVIIQTSYYFVILNLEKKYSVDSDYKITAEFSDKRFSNTKIGSVTTGSKIFF